jgi:hypothetical protein
MATFSAPSKPKKAFVELNRHHPDDESKLVKFPSNHDASIAADSILDSFLLVPTGYGDGGWRRTMHACISLLVW